MYILHNFVAMETKSREYSAAILYFHLKVLEYWYPLKHHLGNVAEMHMQRDINPLHMELMGNLEKLSNKFLR